VGSGRSPALGEKMNIESQSLAAYLFSVGLEQQDSPPAPVNPNIDKIWRSILKFPSESWSPKGDDDEFPILDPGRVLGRMFCAKMDRYLKSRLKLRRHPDTNKQLGITIPLSWILRIAPEDKWTPGQILKWAEDQSEGNLDQDISEIRKFFPNLFNGLKAIDERDKKNGNEMKRLFSEMWEEYNERKLIHVSAPKFHKSWTEIVGEEREKEEDAINAKQQWSMSVDGYFERMCENASKGGTVIQSGGGHVLFLTPKGSKTENIAKSVLRDLRKQFIETDERGWSPRLWASWDPKEGGGGFAELKPTKSTEVEVLIDELCKKYKDSEKDRYRIKERWAIFKYGDNTFMNRGSSKPAIIYLDVIGLGGHCWPKPSDDASVSPYRTRKEAEGGFIKSRNITAVIESTFGLIFSRHLPQRVLAMGGDEIIMQMDSSEWLELVQNVEMHCKKLHASIFPENIRLLWWAMCFEGDSAPDSDTINNLKDTYRNLTDERRVQLMRFVNPMWTSIGDEDSGRSRPKREDKSLLSESLRELRFADLDEDFSELEDDKLIGYDLDEDKWRDWSEDLTAEVLANDMYDTKKVVYFDSKHRIEAEQGAYQGSGAKSSKEIWSMILADLDIWIQEEMSNLDESMVEHIRRVPFSGWKVLLEESTQLAWKKTGFPNSMSKNMKKKIKMIGVIILVKKYEMTKDDFKKWSQKNP